MKTMQSLGRQLSRQIGAHYRLIGRADVTHDDYLQARAESDQAQALARYCLQYLPADQAAVLAHCLQVKL